MREPGRLLGMSTSDTRALLHTTADLAADFLESLPDRPVGPAVTVDGLRTAFGVGSPPPAQGAPDDAVVRDLVAAADPGVMGNAGPRFFGFVVGGAVPASVAADWLATTWDQNAGLYPLAPSASIVEEVAGAWAAELLGLPADCSVGFVTGAQMANVVGLAAARHHVLALQGWDVEADGLIGAPPMQVLVGERRHATIDTALRMLGLGAARSTVVAVDDQGRMRADSLAAALSDAAGPTIVCAQAGEVNTGAFDPFEDLCDSAHAAGAWVHVDGAFGLWAAATPNRRHLVAGVERADSWSTDAHKWLNVPYDSGLAFTRHADAHRAAFASQASYLTPYYSGGPRHPDDWTPELSRRARGFAVYAAIRALGRDGIADLVDRCCGHAERFAAKLGAAQGVEILNDIVLNQVLVRFNDDDAHTREVEQRVQAGGECWMSGTEWQGRAAVRISVSNWSTTTADVDRSVSAILAAHQAG
jgi:glutamate/tyrosine decarboxylase-like PLP-dependent enzyme